MERRPQAARVMADRHRGIASQVFRRLDKPMRGEDDEPYLNILQHNRGFADPDKWLSYARERQFRLVHAEPVEACPDCGSGSAVTIGQYVYYSTLIHLRQCLDCDLVYTDSVIDPEVTSSHWDRAYKDEDYFVRSRRVIFEVVSRLIERSIRAGGSVLDIGGAKGHLMELVGARRPDLRLVVNDICDISCASAVARGLEAVCCPLKDLRPDPAPYDCLVMLDVIYYEPDIRSTWDALRRLCAPKGILLVRIPNKLWLIRAAQALRRLVHSQSRREHQTSIPFYNPEYVLAFSQRYLRDRLETHGFDDIRFLPSPMPVRRGTETASRALYAASLAAHSVTGGKVLLTPSEIVFARRL